MLKPWLKSMWCIPPKQDAAFVAAMEQVFAVYQRPYDPRHPVVCMDEQPIQLVSHSRNPLPMRPGDTCALNSAGTKKTSATVACNIWRPVTLFTFKRPINSMICDISTDKINPQRPARSAFSSEINTQRPVAVWMFIGIKR